MDVDDAIAAIHDYLGRAGVRMVPTPRADTWTLIDDRSPYAEVSLSLPRAHVRSFLRRNHDDASLLGVLIEEELFTDGDDPRWVALKRNVPWGVKLVSGR